MAAVAVKAAAAEAVALVVNKIVVGVIPQKCNRKRRICRFACGSLIVARAFVIF